MKKLILAATIAAITSTSANAATIYEGNGLTYKLKGDWQIQLRDNASKDKNTEVEVDDLEIKNSIVYDLNNGMKAFGQIDFGFKKAAETEIDGSHLEEAYVGLDFGSVKVSIGKQNFASDEFGIEEAYETYTKEDRFDAKATSGDDVVRVDVNMDNITFIASTELAAEGEASDNGEFFDLFVATELAGVELAAAYQSDETKNEDTWGVSASTKVGGVTLAADYSTTDTAAGDLDLYNVAVKFKASATTTVALGLIEEEKTSTVDRSQVYANVTYKFPAQNNVSLFAEIANVDEDGKDLDLDLLAGMRIKF